MTNRLEQWKRLYRRARTMSSKELGTRLRQQATARVDFLRYKLGIDFEPRLIKSNSSRAGPRLGPQFFFPPAEIARLCSLLLQRCPKQVNEIVARADRICEHRFDLLGYKDVDYGEQIDWQADRVHGKRAPRKPGFQIHYLDFAEVGDSKVTWELNRHQQLVTLAKAYRLGGEQKFVNELFRQWRHWHRENPYPVGINWASSLEVAFRSLSWLWVYFLLTGSEAMPAEFRGELLGKLAVSGRHIENYLSTYFSPNTHLLGEATALFFIGTSCPELRLAPRWQERGWALLQAEAQRQVRDDGFYFEQSVYYHVYALDLFLHSAVLASRNGVAISGQFERTLERMLEALCAMGTAGPIPRLGDDDGGRLFDPQRNRGEHLRDPLATGAVLFGRGDFKTLAGELPEETLWLLGEAGVTEFDRLPTVSPVSKSTELQSTGLYVMANDDHCRQLVIDAGPQGADTGGHGHADALSVTANLGGHALLIDSGTFEYVGEGSERNQFRGSRAHNTMVVDGMDQSEPRGPFAWMSLPNVRAEEWIKGETYDFFVGSHDGYTRLPQPVVHRRAVFSRKSRFWLIRDQALGHGKHALDWFWHLDPQFLPTEPELATFRCGAESLSIVTPQNQESSQEILWRDWSPAYGQKQSHCVLHFGTVTALPAEFATLLLAGDTTHSKVENFERIRLPSTEEPAVGYRFKTAKEQHQIVFGGKKPWTMFGWSSDAELLYWSQSYDKTDWTLVFCNGSYAEADNRKIISSRRNISRCEIISINGEIEVTSSDSDVAVSREMAINTDICGAFLE